MWNKKIFLLATISFILLLLFLIILSLSSRKKEENKNISPTETLLPTEIIIQKRVIPTPTLSGESLWLSIVKNKLINGYKFEDIILDYRPKSDLIVVFYPTSKSLAQEQVKKFFEKEGMSDFNSVKLEYIGLRKDPEEPPAGFFR